MASCGDPGGAGGRDSVETWSEVVNRTADAVDRRQVRTVPWDIGATGYFMVGQMRHESHDGVMRRVAAIDRPRPQKWQ